MLLNLKSFQLLPSSLVLISSVSMASVEKIEDAVCKYDGHTYSQGAIVKMQGVVKECRTDTHEREQSALKQQEKAESKGKVVYIAPSLLVGDKLAWRKPLDQ